MPLSGNREVSQQKSTPDPKFISSICRYMEKLASALFELSFKEAEWRWRI